MPLTIGLFAANVHAAADPHGATRIATLAESLGYDSLWVADHVVLPRPRVEPSPMDADEHLLDPLVALAHLAAVTHRIRLGTGCVVLPQRNPLVLAKQLASVDVLSRGRLLFGAAAGYLLPELQALGVQPAGRGHRTNECLQAILSLWYDENPVFHGDHVDFEGVDAHPRPLQRPVPVVIGGHSRAAHRRALTYGDEWFGFMLGLRATAEQLRALDAAAAGFQRSEPLRISVSPARRLDPEVVRSFADLGVHRLVVAPPTRLRLEELEEFVGNNAPERLGAIPYETS
jgi:probable F420-dependent oxidoreductase